MKQHSALVLAELSYTIPALGHGYAGQSLHVNVGSPEVSSRPVAEDMKDRFIGGRGFDLWLLWHAVSDTTRWDSQENEIVISSGPCGGTAQYPGSGKSIAATISPLTDIVVDSNAGGHFGPYLKFAGWDAIELQGIANHDVIVTIDAAAGAGGEGRVQILAAPTDCPVDTHLLGHWINDTFADSEQDRELMAFVTTGSGSMKTRMGCLNFSLYDRKRRDLRYKQAGRGGIGTVFRHKHIRAVVVRTPSFGADSNGPADPERIAQTGADMRREVTRWDPVQNRMRHRGTAYLVQIMDDYDLLPVMNFRYGAHPDTHLINGAVWEQAFTQNLPDGCWYGCTVACAHAVDNYRVQTGPYAGGCVIVDGPEYETVAGVGSNCGIFDPGAILEINFYCDTYGIDTISFGTSMAFAMECYEAGVLTKDHTGGIELTSGNAASALAVLHQMAQGTGFGLIFGQGIHRMKRYFVETFGADAAFLDDIGMEAKGLEYSEYVTKESLAQQGGYGLTNKGPQHDEAWLIFMDQVNNQLPTFRDKAEALHYFPMWRTWFGLSGFCKLPWNDVVDPKNALSSEPAKIPHHVENYVRVFNGVTGKEVTVDDLIRMSERVYNFQRVFNIRLGKGLREHDRVPYRSQGPVTPAEYTSRQERYDQQLREWLGLDPTALNIEEKLVAHRTHRTRQYELLTDAVYARRGWTADGVPTPETLASLGIDDPDVLAVVRQHL
jgi:aldehyde:ferredoxin oxidoreductase